MTDPVETHQTDPARDSQPERIASVEQRLHVDVVEHETATVRVRKLVHQEVVDSRGAQAASRDGRTRADQSDRQ